MKKYLSTADLSVIGLTIVLFVVALFAKGITKDLLLEAGVLLVSIKLIMMNYKHTLSIKAVTKDLDEIKRALTELKTQIANKA